MQFPIQTCLSLDVDWVCVDACHSTFGGFLKFHGIPVESDSIGELPCLLVVQSDVLKFDWVLLTSHDDVYIWVCSPPCLPWSKAFVNAPGLRRKDGMLTQDLPPSPCLHSWIAFVCLENAWCLAAADQ